MGVPATYWDAFAAAQRGAAWIDAHAKAGYRIGIFSSATLLSPAFDRTVFASIPALRQSSDGANAIERDLDAMADSAAFLGAGPSHQPYFAVLYVDAAYGPSVPEGAEVFLPQWNRVDHLALDANFDPLPYINRYWNALHWLDARLREWLDAASKAGHLDNTLLILTSDHGDEFDDLGQNYWGHGSNFTQHQTHVPLLTLWPGQPRERIEYRTSHYDLAPTVLEKVLGCSGPISHHSIGHNLFDERTPRDWLPVVSYYNLGIVFNDKIISTWPTGGYEVLGPDNQPIADTSLPDGVGVEILDALSRYYRRQRKLSNFTASIEHGDSVDAR